MHENTPKRCQETLIDTFYDFRHQLYAFTTKISESRKTGDEDPLIFRGGRQVVTQCDIAVAPITFLFFFFLYDLRITRDMIRSLPVFFLLVYGQQRTTEWTEWEECDYQLEVRHNLQSATLKWFSFRL